MDRGVEILWSLRGIGMVPAFLWVMNRTLQLRKLVGGQHLLMGWLLHPVSLIAFFLLSLMAALCAGGAEPSPAGGVGRISFDNLDPAQEVQAMEVYATARAHFTRLTSREVGEVPVRVRIVERLGRGEASRTVGQMLGVTVYVDGESVVQISAAQTRSFGRVLAHELTHAFVREAYGTAVNRSLSEGLSEYIASQFYGAEVNRDIRAASAVVMKNPRLMPYVNGYNFCLHHADRPGFGKFFESQIKMPDFGLGHLEAVWKRQEQGA